MTPAEQLELDAERIHSSIHSKPALGSGIGLTRKQKITFSENGFYPGFPKRNQISRNATPEKDGAEWRLFRQLIRERDAFLHQGSWEWDVRTGEKKLSSGIYLLFGYTSPEEMRLWDLRNNEMESHMDPAEIRRDRRDWLQILKEADTYLRETEIISRDGHRRVLETYGRVYRNKNGYAVSVIGTTRDITRLKDYEHQLELKIDELNRSNRDLEEFAYIASHDLHEPLRKLSTFGERLLVGAKEDLSPENQDYLRRMLKATETMRMLIDNLLEYSRVTRGAATFIKTDIRKLIVDVIAEQELRIEETGAKIEIGEFPEMEVVPAQISQLFNNLLSNAIKFSQPGIKPRIIFRSALLTPEDKYSYRLKDNREYMRITVRDNGIGFEKTYAEKIFQIFQRLHGKSAYPGSGIGLAICKKIAENHKGLIYAESEPGNGASFHVILPMKP